MILFLAKFAVITTLCFYVGLLLFFLFLLAQMAVGESQDDRY